MKPPTKPAKILRSGPNWDVFDCADNPTPQGGVEAMFMYSDEHGNSATRDTATRCEIHEFAADGTMLPRRTYGLWTPTHSKPPDLVYPA